MTTTRTAARRPSASPARTPARRGRLGLPLVAALAVAAMALVAVALAGAEPADPALQQTAPVTVEGDALPVFTPGQPDPAAGMPAPALEGSGFDGSYLEFTPGEHPTVLLFAAHWCSFCQQEVAELSPWLAEAGPGDVKLLVVSTGVDAAAPNYPPSAWFTAEGWPGAVLADSDGSAAAEAFGLSGYPFFVFLDADGSVVGRHSGALGAAQLQEITDALQPATPAQG